MEARLGVNAEQTRLHLNERESLIGRAETQTNERLSVASGTVTQV